MSAYGWHQTEPNLWTVYDTTPDNPVSDHGSPDEAGLACSRLNREPWIPLVDYLMRRVAALETAVGQLERGNR